MSDEAPPVEHAQIVNQPLRIMLDRTSRQLAFFGQCTLFVFVVFTAVFSISELAARETMLGLLSSRLSALKSDFVERTRVRTALQSAPTAPTDKSSSPLPEEEERYFVLRQIELIGFLHRRAQALVALGVDTPSTSLRSIQAQFESNGLPSPPPLAMSLADTRGTLAKYFDSSTGALRLLSSDQLLAIVVISCGAIGSMIASLRGNQSLSLRSFVLGLASGFIAFLLIKGGKHVFLLQSQNEVIAFNPYGSAFAGLLAGLFTERAHELLTWVVDDVVDRIRAASTHTTRK